jgi:outer membrane protein OmpA-like peptidoglycan-associated protein
MPKVTVMFVLLLLGLTTASGDPADRPFDPKDELELLGSSSSNQQSRAKIRLSGTVISQDAETFTVLDSGNQKRLVRKTAQTRYIRTERLTPRRDDRKPASVMRGLYVNVVGVRGDNEEVIAQTVSYTDLDYRVAVVVDKRATPLEERVDSSETRISGAEENAQRISGQLDELAGVSNAARGGAKASQETADAAVAGVNATNERIAALDDYQNTKVVSIEFAANSAELTEQARPRLKELGLELSQMKGYVVEVAGFSDNSEANKGDVDLSQQRADGVARYLVRSKLVPIARMLVPMGYGTGESGTSSRRVEIRILTNRGLLQTAPTMSPPRRE